MHCEASTSQSNPKKIEIGTTLKELAEVAVRASRKDLDKTYMNMLHIDTRYVSNVSIGFKVKPTMPHVRYKPYALSRHRTKSECNDGETYSFVESMVDKCIGQSLEEIAQLKRAKSLESILKESNIDLNKISLDNLQELEVVNNSIQNLKVIE